jgi:MerR family transcriptional regulator/heat shock protein HspR
MVDKDKFLKIGEVAKQLSIHDQTIRMYERKGLIKPTRSEHNTRLFTRNDITKVTTIITLTLETLNNNFKTRLNMAQIWDAYSRFKGD